MSSLFHILDKIYLQSIPLSAIEVIKYVNKILFEEDRIINDYNQKDLIILAAYINEVVVGFKIGYGTEDGEYYSAKSGVLPQFRRRGVATKLLYRMILEAKKKGYKKLVFDTFPERFPGMLDLGLKEGFKPDKAEWNSIYNDYKLRMKLDL
ncbi:MAG: GNAT family N-acetyltransferase [Balneolales bacterium]